ncbi:MAG: hypothetical protein AAGJ12_11085 [Bacteroidota bacterium]
MQKSLDSLPIKIKATITLTPEKDITDPELKKVQDSVVLESNKEIIVEIPKYVIDLKTGTVSLQTDTNETGTMSCGLILSCVSHIYQFQFFDTGAVNIVYNNLQSYENRVQEFSTGLASNHTFHCKLVITRWDYTLFVNDRQITTGTFDCKSWDKIAPFTGSSTKTAVDYLKIIRG